MWGVYLGRLPAGCSRPPLCLHGQLQICWFLCRPFGLHPLPWYWSMLVTMATGVESGHLVHLSNTTHTHTQNMFRLCVWWFGGHAWWSLGSLGSDYWPTNQLPEHMDRNYSLTLCSALLHSPPPHAQVSLLTIALLLTCSFFLMNHWVHLHRSGNSTLVIPHVSHRVLFPSDMQAHDAWKLYKMRWDHSLAEMVLHELIIIIIIWRKKGQIPWKRLYVPSLPCKPLFHGILRNGVDSKDSQKVNCCSK